MWVNSKGICHIQIHALNFSLNYKNIYVSPGDTVEFTLNKAGETVIQGKDERYQNYEQYRVSEFDNKFISPFQKAKDSSLNLQTYKTYCLEYFDNEQKYINNYFHQPGNKVLKNYLLDRSKYLLVDALCTMPVKLRDYKKIDIPADYLSTKYIALFNNPNPYLDYSYTLALSNYNSFIAGVPNDSVFMLIQSAKRIFCPPVYYYLLMDEMKTISIFGNISYANIVNKIKEELRVASLDSKTLAKIQKCYTDFQMLSKNIKDFSNIKLKTIDGKIVRLGDIIRDKTLYYIDFWASWCGACIQEFPYLQTAKVKYPQIKFISLSIDKNEAAWKKAFRKYNQSTKDSYLLVDPLKNKLTVDYNVKYIPRFLFFNSSGKCITGSATRPSDADFSFFLERNINK